VRELRNAIERAVILAHAPQLELEDLPAELAAIRARTVELGALVPLDALEEEHMRRVIARTARLEDAAEILGIDIATLYRKRKRWSVGGASAEAAAKTKLA
jgi:NtrC-family two-component system response regulator AlgB